VTAIAEAITKARAGLKKRRSRKAIVADSRVIFATAKASPKLIPKIHSKNTAKMNKTGLNLARFSPMYDLIATANAVIVKQVATQVTITIPALFTSNELENTGKKDEVSATIAVITPAAMNVHVAKMDLNRNADMPQTPCPEVQPFPEVVPKPTKKPATTKRDIGKGFQL
jgi:hypothetical protein